MARNNKDYLSYARLFFKLHAVAVLGICVTLFYMLMNHFFEYQYVWQHSNRSMDMKYILSCFWEGQEGSFLLWTFWNVILGLLLMRNLKQQEWEAPVLAVFSLVQVFLASMILGVYIGDYKIGSNPFLLLREHPDFMNLPFIQNANYLEKLDGRGLNPLLMNYWMTIHPPTLFLGFSSTLAPFAFAIAALWNKKYTSWQALALPWTFFSVLILGIGILMGGAWAYEALSFGGFWAWDPVENSSLVPWLVIVAAGHTMVINKNKGGSLFTTHMLAIGSFLLVLYSTFLTRSGILGNASVHAFTDLGMQGQLVLYVLVFVFISILFLIKEDLLKSAYGVLSFMLLFFAVLYNFKKLAFGLWCSTSIGITFWSYYKHFPKQKQEEALFSREFWIFTGSLVLLLSALIISYFTSLPVLNKLFGSNYAQLKVSDYNRFMIPFSIVLVLLMAGGQFLKYKNNDKRAFFKQLRFSLLLSLLFGLVVSIPLYFVQDEPPHSTYSTITFTVLMVGGFFTVFANLEYTLRILKGRILKAGASIAHIGFALIILGALISTSKKITLSKNTATQKVSDLGADFDDRKSILLVKGDTLPMGPYLVTYAGKERIGIDVYFNVDYLKVKVGSAPEFDFRLRPKVQDNPRMGKAAEPDTRHYLNRDIYTHVTYADLNAPIDSVSASKYNEPKNYIGHIKDTIFASNAIVVIDSLATNVNEKEYSKNDSLLEVTAILTAFDINGNSYKARPKFIIRNNMAIPTGDEIEELGLKFIFWKINPEEGSVEITMSERVGNARDFIVMEAHLFPFINVLWLGCLVMAIGTGIAIIERLRLLRRKGA